MAFGSQSYYQILLFHIPFAVLPQNLRSSILIFLVIRYSQYMGSREIIPFAVHYRNNMKIVKGTFLIFWRMSKTSLKAALDILSNSECILNIKVVISLLIWMNQYN